MEESVLLDSFPENVTNFQLNNSKEFIEKLFGPKRDSLCVVVPITIIYGIIFFTGLVGNISTCVVISRNKSMHTATNYYLFSLAISDLLLLVSGLPQEVYWIWSRYPYVFGQVFCVLRGLFSETSANATVLTITAFTVERYIAICHPFLSHTVSKLSRAIKFVMMIWLVAVAFAVPQALQFEVIAIEGIPESKKCDAVRTIIPHSFEFSTFVFFIAPMSLITVLYALIGMRLKRSSKMKKVEFSARSYSVNSRNQGNATTKIRQGQSSRKVLKMLVAVVVAFFVCWAPFHTQRLVAIYGTIPVDHEDRQKFFKIYEIVTYTSGVLYYFSTTINPVLYNIMSNKFREAFKETFTRCCGFVFIKTKQPKRSYSILTRSNRRGPDSCTDSSVRDEASIHTNITNTSETCHNSLNPQRCFSKRNHEEHFSNFSSNTETFTFVINKRMNHSPVLINKPTSWKLFKKSTLKRNESVPQYTTNAEKDIDGIQLSVSSCDISNSSLKDVNNAVLEYELSDYLSSVEYR